MLLWYEFVWAVTIIIAKRFRNANCKFSSTCNAKICMLWEGNKFVFDLQISSSRVPVAILGSPPCMSACWMWIQNLQSKQQFFILGVWDSCAVASFWSPNVEPLKVWMLICINTLCSGCPTMSRSFVFPKSSEPRITDAHVMDLLTLSCALCYLGQLLSTILTNCNSTVFFSIGTWYELFFSVNSIAASAPHHRDGRSAIMQLHFCRFQVRRRITIISIYYRFGLTIVPLRFFFGFQTEKRKNEHENAGDFFSFKSYNSNQRCPLEFGARLEHANAGDVETGLLRFYLPSCWSLNVQHSR